MPWPGYPEVGAAGGLAVGALGTADRCWSGGRAPVAAALALLSLCAARIAGIRSIN